MDQFLEFVTNHHLLSMGWMAIFTAIVASFVLSKLSPVKSISTHDMTMMVNREEGLVVDIRAEKEFNQGHILGATFVSPEKVTKNEFTALENKKDKPIIVVCAAGMSAGRTARQMAKQGFSRVFTLQGGFAEWQNQKLPVTKK